ncbi:MAG TPA: Stp1/IreP family PP2C-type Ser/Thr phosphatase [Ktedonobacteraceae bacterium]|nr:Stp1/IreP family PP2C-type Ser/Thr phosphatase [Ktedonobacteraceae bacterium]
MAKQLRLDPAQLTDVGRKREHNEDNMAYVIPKDPQVMAMKGALFIVADGMGGHAAGEVASEIAVDTVSNAYYMDDNEDITTPLLQAIKRANLAIHQRAAENMLRSGMGTTCVAAVLRGNMAYIANVGDSRAYMVRGSQVRQITQDHSWVAEQVRAGLLTEEQARTHAQRNVITRCLGTQPDVDVDVFLEPLQENDCLILCTDGLSGLLSDEDLTRIVEQSVPQESVYHLVERANENGGPDNITAIVVRVQEVGVEPPGVRSPVRVGGREVSEANTGAMGTLVGSPLPFTTNTGDVRVSSSPLHLSSGPLAFPDSVTAPQPALGKYRHNRLFFPTLLMIFLLVAVLTGGGILYFLHSNENQTQAFVKANQLITKAKNEVATNPAQALNDLSSAQKNLPASGGNQASLQNELVTQVQTAIVNYNSLAKIQTLPCSASASNIINPSTQLQSIAAVQYAKNTALFALGQGTSQSSSIYQLNNQHNLVSSLQGSATSSYISIASGGTQLFVLAKLVKKDNVPPGYTLSQYTLDPTGMLKQPPLTTTIDQAYTSGGYVPILITAWGSNVYVALSNANQGPAKILSYSADGKGHLVAAKPYIISNSSPIISMATFANQLFLLTDGAIQSLPLTGGQLSQAFLPTPVLVQSPIQTPLSVSQSGFNSSMTVPTPTVTPLQSSTLIVPTAGMLAAGVVNNVSHLYIGDPANNRVLDLDEEAASPGGTSTPTTTPAGTGTPTGNTVTMQLVRQFVSPQELKVVQGIAVDPQGNNVNILAQTSTPSQLNLVSVSTSGCTP